MTEVSKYFINLEQDFPKRFSIEKFLPEVQEGLYDTLISMFLHEFKKLPVVSTYTVIAEESRPELLSYNIYGDVQYWWLLMYYNDIADPDDLVLGKIIKIFSLDDLEDLYFRMKSLELSQ